MQHRLRLLLGLALLLDGGRAWAAPAPANVPYTKTPIQVTGAISQFPASSQLFTISGTINNTATFHGAWDDQNLYIGIQVQDTALFCTPEPPDSQNAWNNDAIELMFDLKNKKTITTGDQDFRQWIFLLAGQGSTYDAYGCGGFGDTSFTGTATVGVQLQGTLNDANPDTGYTMIVAIPWTDLAITPANAVSFGFDAAVDDVDAVAGSCTFQDWAGLATVFAQPDQWSSLTLVGKGTTPGGDGSVGPRPDGGGSGGDAGGWPLADKGGVVSRPKESVGCSLAQGYPSGAPLVVLVLVACAICPIMRARRRGRRKVTCAHERTL